MYTLEDVYKTFPSGATEQYKILRAFEMGKQEGGAKIQELEAQIEKMKCCENCCYFNIDKNIGTGNLYCDLMLLKKEYCRNKDHWKFLRR